MTAWPPLTIPEVDERIYACRGAYIQAVEDADELTADAMQATMDELFERRAIVRAQTQ